jgi:hypothetical protein
MSRTDPHAFRRAVEAHDLEAMMATFADDAVLNSPVSFRPFRGKPVIGGLLGILLEVFQDFEYTEHLRSEDGTQALIFRARVAGRDVQGLDLLKFDDAGKVRDLTVMVRPRSAVEALMNEVGPRLAALSGGSGG